MNNFYENMQSFAEKAILFIKKANASIEKTHTGVLRERYYQNLTYLERMAKTYGELNFTIKWTLKINLFCGVGASIFLLGSPIFFLLLSLSLPFLLFLEEQYQVMETRFCQLISDLQVSEQKLQEMTTKNQDLNKQLNEALEQNQKVVKQLEACELEIQKIKERVAEKERYIQEASRIIESLALNVQQTTDNFMSFQASSEKQTVQFLDYLGELCLEVGRSKQALESTLSFDVELKESFSFQHSVNQFLEQKYGAILAKDKIELPRALAFFPAITELEANQETVPSGFPST